MDRKGRFFVSLFLGLGVLGFGQGIPLRVAVGLSLPPYVIQDQGKGIEVDILRQALEGYDIQLQFVPLARVPVSLEEGSADAALTINEASGLKNVFYSDVHVVYQNVVLTLKSRNLTITKLADLGKLRVAAFQNAQKYLGADFAAMAQANRRYEEVVQQQTQVKFLFIDRADALVSDINIFKYFWKSITDTDVSAPYVISELFPPTSYKVAFKDAAVRDKFNAGLKRLKATKKYDQILASYLK